MYNKAWIYLAIALVPVALVLDVRALLVLSTFILTVMPIASWWNRHSLDGVTCKRSFAEESAPTPVDGRLRAFPGEKVDLTLHIANQKLLPCSWLEVQDRWSLALPVEDGHLVIAPSRKDGYFRAAFSARWFERVNRRCRIRCTRRGFYPFGPLTLRSGDIFGL